MIFNSKIEVKSFSLSTFLLISVLVLFPKTIISQISLNSYTEVGKNAISQVVYGNLSAQIVGKSGHFQTSAGGLLSFSNANENLLSAFLLTGSNDFQLKSSKITLESLLLWKPISTDLRETNLGLLAEYKFQHVGLKMGFNTRFYSFSPSAIIQNNFPDSVQTTLWEPVNLMYKFYYLHDIGAKMTFEAAVTNFDRYFIQQETNPMILLKFGYNYKSNINIYSELGYLQAGLLNLHVNAFGVFLRGGVVWQIN